MSGYAIVSPAKRWDQRFTQTTSTKFDKLRGVRRKLATVVQSQYWTLRPLSPKERTMKKQSKFAKKHNGPLTSESESTQNAGLRRFSAARGTVLYGRTFVFTFVGGDSIRTSKSANRTADRTTNTRAYCAKQTTIYDPKFYVDSKYTIRFSVTHQNHELDA